MHLESLVYSNLPVTTTEKAYLPTGILPPSAVKSLTTHLYSPPFASVTPLIRKVIRLSIGIPSCAGLTALSPIGLSSVL